MSTGDPGSKDSRSRMELANLKSKSLSICPFCGPQSLEKVGEGSWRCLRCGGEFSLPDPGCRSPESSEGGTPAMGVSAAAEASHSLLNDRRVVSEELLEKTIRRRDCRLCAMMLEAPLPVLLHTEDGQILALNQAFVDHTGYTLHEIADLREWLGRGCRVPAGELEAALERLCSEPEVPEERPVFTRSGDLRTWRFYGPQELSLYDGSVLKALMAVDVTDQKQSERQLEEANQRLCNLFTHAPMGMAIFEARSPYRIAAHNPAYLKVWPESLQEEGIVGRNLIDLLPADERSHVQEVFGEVCQTRQPKTIHEFYHVSPRKGESWWNWSLTPVLENDEVIAFIHMLSEVTDAVRGREEMTQLVETHTAELRKTKERLERQVDRRQRAQAILRRHMELHRKVIDNIPVMLTFHDAEGNLQLLNREFYRLTGWTAGEVNRMDRPMEAFFPDPKVRSLFYAFMRHDSGKDWSEFPIATRSGERIESLWRTVQLSDGSLIGIGLDMRQRLESERKLESLNRDLKRRAEQLHFLAAEVTEAEDRERRLLAELLHDDLQQMLVAAKYQLNFVREGAAGNDTMQTEIDDLLGILNESIAKTRGLSHELSPPALHQESLARALTALAGQMKEKHGLDVEVEAVDDYKSPVDNIKSFIFKAVQEMLFNIIKHAGTDRATVKLWQKGFEFNVSVTDRGRGFNAAEQERWQHSPGGMGLFKIQERVRLMGGRCRVVSAPGEGTSITVSLPVRPVPRRTRKFNIVDKPDTNRSRSTARPRGDAEQKIRIVLADDHDVVRKGIASLLLKESDIEIVGQASDGRQAVELAKELHPDLILMDVAMPQLDGLEATRILQSENPDIKIVALSMFDKKDMAEQLLKAGAMLYLNKSDAFEELLGAIRKIMGADPPVYA